MKNFEDKMNVLAGQYSGPVELEIDDKIFDYTINIFYDYTVPEDAFGFIGWAEGLQKYQLPKFGSAVDSMNNNANAVGAGVSKEHIAEHMIQKIRDSIQQKVRESVKV